MKKTKSKTTTTPTKKLPRAALDTTPRATLTLTRSALFLTRHDETGAAISTFPVHAGDVAACWTPFGITTGLILPDVLFIQQRGGKERIGLWLPPAKHTLTFQVGKKEKTITIPLPGLIFVGCGMTYSIVATGATRPTKGSEAIYIAPLPNVYISGGYICAGNVRFPKCAMDTIHKARTLFFESLFNADLSGEKTLDTSEEEDDFYIDEDGEGDPGDAINMARDHNEIARRGRGSNSKKEQTLFAFLSSLKSARNFPMNKLIQQGTLQDVMNNTSEVTL